MDGLNLKKVRDSFNLKDNILSVLMEIKKIFVKSKIQVKVKNKAYNVVGRLGMYHAVIDITENKNITIGDEVDLLVSPIYVNSNIRREYV